MLLVHEGGLGAAEHRMDEELAFLRALLHQPTDALRLVYADWLTERGDPRADFLRLEVELHQLERGDRRRVVVQRRLDKLQAKIDRRWATWVLWPRVLKAGDRLDLARVAGSGRIEVRGSVGSETALLVEGQPVALNWDDMAGSAGQYLVFTGHACGEQHVNDLRQQVDEGFVGEAPLADQLEPLLAQFAPGVYSIVLTRQPAMDVMALRPGQPTDVAEMISYYPEPQPLVCTQPAESLDAGGRSSKACVPWC